MCQRSGWESLQSWGFSSAGVSKRVPDYGRSDGIVGVVPDVSVPTPVEIPINTADMGMAAISESSPPSIPVVDVVAAVADAGIFAPSSVGSEHLLGGNQHASLQRFPLQSRFLPRVQESQNPTPADTNMTTSVDARVQRQRAQLRRKMVTVDAVVWALAARSA